MSFEEILKAENECLRKALDASKEEIAHLRALCQMQSKRIGDPSVCIAKTEGEFLQLPGTIQLIDVPAYSRMTQFPVSEQLAKAIEVY